MEGLMNEASHTKVLTFPIKGLHKFILGEYLPLDNLAWAFIFPKNSIESLLVQIHEFYSHPIFSLYSDVHSSLLFAHFMEKIKNNYAFDAPIEQTQLSSTSELYHFWFPIVEATALANLYFIDRNVFYKYIHQSNYDEVQYAKTIIETIEALTRAADQDMRFIARLDPIVKKFVNIILFKCEKGTIEEVAASMVWGGQRLMAALKNHLLNPQKYKIPKKLKESFWWQKWILDATWFETLLLSAHFLQHGDLEDQRYAISFFSRQLLDEVRKCHINISLSRDRDNKSSCVMFFSMRPYFDLSDLDLYMPRGSLRPKKIERPENLFEIESSHLFINYLMAYSRNTHRVFKELMGTYYVFKDLYSKGSKLSDFEIRNICHLYAVTKVFDLIKNAFTLWQEDERKAGIGWFFSYLKEITQSSNSSSFDCVLKRVLAELSLQFLKNYQTEAFKTSLLQALQSTRYYDENTILTNVINRVKYLIKS